MLIFLLPWYGFFQIVFEFLIKPKQVYLFHSSPFCSFKVKVSYEIGLFPSPGRLSADRRKAGASDSTLPPGAWRCWPIIVLSNHWLNEWNSEHRNPFPCVGHLPISNLLRYPPVLSRILFQSIFHYEISKILNWVADVSHTTFLSSDKLLDQNPCPQMLLTAGVGGGYLEVYYMISSILYMFEIFHNF